MTNGEGNLNERYRFFAEFMRYSHELVSKKFDTMVLVNGIFFAAFNFLNIKGGYDSFPWEMFILTFIGIVFSFFWWLNIERSIGYTKRFKGMMEAIEDKVTNGIYGNKKEFEHRYQRIPAHKIIRLVSFLQAAGWITLLIVWVVKPAIESYCGC